MEFTKAMYNAYRKRIKRDIENITSLSKQQNSSYLNESNSMYLLCSDCKKTINGMIFKPIKVNCNSYYNQKLKCSYCGRYMNYELE